MVPFNAQTLLLNLQTCIVHVDFQEKGITEISLHYQLSSQKSIFHFKDSLPRHLMAGHKNVYACFPISMSLGSLKERTKIKVRIDENSRMNKAPNVTLLLLKGSHCFGCALCFALICNPVLRVFPLRETSSSFCTWMLAFLFAFL